ncbi:heme lyase CcmF/NrfE family subunit [Motilimonas pumila]|uniref:Heme lyase CcmF/NrfE family subunit n=1 Tax=Motilimonas pumila TaxID=2303987 RepID=A0A418YGR5_9GAMM|nr:heme lyase CcmF/NrfE family subunit [Motilimonas pumila]RJG49052.1 heme lyase CcmF/NrfE family subunit [Motilimonas pumila]
MIPELGQFTLIIALGLSVLLSIYPLWGAHIGHSGMMNSAKTLAVTQFLFVGLSFACLTYAFIVNDFTVAYVASHSNSELPLQYRISAVWGSHEGSLLLWVLILAGWTAAVALLSKQLPLESVARVLAVMGMLGVGFYLFIVITSNPFERTLPYFPVDGRDLNPLLQDIGLILHPPMLYMGYVGFSVAFAFAIASLMAGQLDSAWARWSRPWTMAAWIFLTIGIALGSWWAYYELGWGGWWFWDPVENASFMPWLAGTALIHSLAVTEKRGVFKSWTVLLALSAFSLSLLGTFLVRSGVLVSVHAFASDPERGLFILAFLILVIGGSLLLFAIKASAVKSNGRYQLFSRETFLLGNNILLIAALIVVLLGTLLPLVHKEIGLGSISIGEPFFNKMFTLLIVPFMLMLGVGPLVRWKKQHADDLLKPLLLSLVISVLLCVAFLSLFAPSITWLAILGVFLGCWVSVSTAQETWLRATHRNAFVVGIRKLSLSHWAMALGHLGFAICVIGITMTQNFSIEKDVRMVPGDSIQFQDYEFQFEGVSPLKGPNFDGHTGVLQVYKGGQYVTELAAEKRFYRVQRNVMTEAAIDAGITRDLYAALGEQLDDGAWALRIYYKPFIRWIWGGALIMSLGGLLAMLDKRYRVRRRPVRKEAIA